MQVGVLQMCCTAGLWVWMSAELGCHTAATDKGTAPIQNNSLANSVRDYLERFAGTQLLSRLSSPAWCTTA